MSITPQVGVWMQRWEEHEKGWGKRKDGCFLYPTQEEAITDTANILAETRKQEAAKGFGLGNPPDEYSSPIGEPIFIQVTPTEATEVAEAKRVYRKYWIQ